jgi:peptide/nickel transport system permease protein
VCSSDLSQKKWNEKIGVDNSLLLGWVIEAGDSPEAAAEKVSKMGEWYEANKSFYDFEPTLRKKISLFFFDTRFAKYMSRVFTLDFGTMRNDDNKRVIDEVVKRFKYSLTLSLTPMIITFVACQLLGVLMAVKHASNLDYGLNLILLFFYAIPVFVAAPFLIEKVALYHDFPFTDTPIPISGFTSPNSIYQSQTTWQRLVDVLQHIALPLVAILYGTLAAQARLARTAVLEVLRQDYVRTAKAKGVPMFPIIFKHVGRNAAITIVTSIASSLGIILGGSLIVETLFEIDGFGKFFYDAILNRDYNVIMFSALAGAFLSLMGYLVADIAYTVLDPRVTLD